MGNFKYKGTIHFHDWGPLRKRIENCILREGTENQEIVIDFKDNDNDKTYYSVRLTRSGNNTYKGEILNETNLPYSIDCRYYRYENNIALIGEWAQFGQDFCWNCELEMESELPPE
jgi:hypothetical protein